MKFKKGSLLTFLIFLSTIFLGISSSHGDPLDNWHWRNPLPQGNNLNGVAFGNGTFVSVGDIGSILTSTNGTNWNVAAPKGTTLNRVIYADGQFVAVGSSGAILTSPDGVNWTQQQTPTSASLLSIAYGNSLFAVGGAGGTLLVSSNALQWNLVSAGTTNDYNWIAFGDGTFTLPTSSLHTPYSGTSTIMLSSNGINWTQYPVPNSGVFYGSSVEKVTFGNGEFLAYVLMYIQSGFYNAFFSSTDGIHWTQGAQISQSNQTLYAANNQFFIPTYPSPVVSLSVTSDGNTLAPANVPSSFTMNDIAYGNGVYVVPGANGDIVTSPYGTNWSTVTTGWAPRITSMATGQGQIVALGPASPNPGNGLLYGFPGTILVSSNGLSFSPAPSFNTNQCLGCVSYGGGDFVAVGTSGALQWSSDGLNWTTRPAGTTNSLAGVCYGNGIWVAIGGNGSVVTSPTGLAWTLRTSGTGENLLGVVYGGGQFVAVGYEGTVITSPDGINWTVQYVNTLASLFRVAYGNGRFAAAGSSGTIVSSTDGVNWNVTTASTSAPLYGLDFGNGEFLAAGGSGDTVYYDYAGSTVLFRSHDGVNWQSVNTPTDWNLHSVTFMNGAFWIAGGNSAILESDPIVNVPALAGQKLANNGGFQLSLIGMGGQNIKIQCSTNLVASNWTDAAAITNCPQYMTWTDTNAMTSPAKYYRVVKE